MSETAILNRLHWRGAPVDGAELMRHIFDGPHAAEYEPRFRRQFGNLTHPLFLARYLRHLISLFDLARQPVVGTRILEAGCGYGSMALLLALLGASESHGVDVRLGILRTFLLSLEALPMRLPVYPVLSDSAELPYETGYLDSILSVEAISHYRRVENFLLEAARVLKPGGVLIISDANNGANPVRAWRTRQLWQHFEHGPTAENYYGHRIVRSYVDSRREIIANAFPDLSEAALTRLAEETSGLWRDEIIAAALAYKETGRWPGHRYRYGTCPLDPKIGHYSEFLFNPVLFGREIAEYGFEVSVHAYFGGARGGWVAVANHLLGHRLISPFSLAAARAFRIVARRK